MHNTQTFSLEWGGRTLTFETGKLAALASGAVRVQYGDTVVLATVTMSKDTRDGIGYFPLMVDYEENLYAAGKIKGSRFIKREGRPSDEAILNARITDRSLRPLFDERIRNDIQVVISVLSIDNEQDPALIGLIAAATAVGISEIPAEGPVAGIGIAQVNGEYVLNPTPEQREASDLYVFAAIRDDKVVMIEAEGSEASEDATLGAIEKAIELAQPVLAQVREIIAQVGKEKVEPILAAPSEEEEAVRAQVEAKAKAYLEQHIESIFGITSKNDRDAKEREVKAGMMELFETEEEQAHVGGIFEHYYENAFRTLILEKGIRVDGRAVDQVRELHAEVDVLPRTHGSAIFQRGETQVMSTVTLGSPGEGQIIDGINPEYTKTYMHHYKFPPFSVGDVRPLRGPGRREIGHGMLAEKALESMIPNKEVFPYTIRVVSEVLMSNGSSSQASACGSTLALMAAGVPIKNPVAGIAMGLVMNEDGSQYKVLTDIQGIEDHAGDMDFKVAGTANGVTAIQLDIKLHGITLDMCRDTLEQAKQARLGILEVMNAAISEPRAELSPYAPRIEQLSIDPNRIGEIIGTGGKVINDIIEKTGAQIDIEEDGTVFVATPDGEQMTKAIGMIEAILKDIEPGEVYEGMVSKIVTDRNSGSEIGAIVDLGGGKDGMIHISNVCHGRIATVSAVLQVGETVKVKVLEVDKEKGRIGLSRKDMIEPGTPDPKCENAEQAGGGRDDRRGPRGPRRNGGGRDRRGPRNDRGPRSGGQRSDRGPRNDRAPKPRPAGNDPIADLDENRTKEGRNDNRGKKPSWIT